MTRQAMKILIVDDNPVNVDVLRTPLEQAGYEIYMAPSGEVTLKLAPQVMPDLILLDVMMPGLDGFETCLQLKANKDLSDIPVIFVTGKTDTEDIIKGFQAGGADYINKPFRHEEILARVATQLKLRRANQKNRMLVEDLKKAIVNMEDARQETLAKTQFLARMTHELRTPMTAILGFAELLMRNSRGHLDEKDLSLVGEVCKAGDHLMQLINRVLDYSELDEETLRFETEPVRLSRLVREVVESRTVPPDSGIEIEACFNGMEGQNVQANPARLREIVDILIDNAVKYNVEGGRVLIECEVTPAGRVRLSVVDEGAGIPETEKDKVFLPLYRLAKHVEEVDGIGMGLACARKYASLMDATLDVEPGPQGGSRFNLEMSSAHASEKRPET